MHVSSPSSFRGRPASAATLLLCLLLLPLGLLGCGGGEGTPDPFEEGFPLPGAGGGGGGSTTPPPAPPATPVWTADAAVLGRTALFGSFPSDLVRYGTTLFVTDADAVETNGARILAYDVAGAAPTASTAFATTTILPTDLVDSAGNPGDAAAPVGFGYFVNDIEVVSPSLGFALVNAGGSDSAPTLSNLVVFNPSTGALRQVLDLANTYATGDAIADSNGVPIPGGTFVQSGAEAIHYVDHGAGIGRLYVAMSNLVFGAPSFGADKLPGTVQVLDVATGRPAPVTVAGNGSGGPLVIRTRAFNPVALASIVLPPVVPTAGPHVRLLVTCAGTTGFDADFNLVPTTASSVEAYDGAGGAFQGRFDLGLAGLAAVRPAIGFDAAGHLVGFYPSSVTGELYLLRLDGLRQDPISPSTLAVLRGPNNGIPITAAQAGTPGGNLTGVALSPDGRTLAVVGFGDLFATPVAPGKLYLLALPTNLVAGSGFGADFTPGSTEFASVGGRTLGRVVLVAGDGTRPDVYTGVSGTLDASFLGSGPASIGSLQTHGLIK